MSDLDRTHSSEPMAFWNYRAIYLVMKQLIYLLIPTWAIIIPTFTWAQETTSLINQSDLQQLQSAYNQAMQLQDELQTQPSVQQFCDGY